MQVLPFLPKQLCALQKPPKKLFYIGKLELLNGFKIAVVGTRKPNQYTRNLTSMLVSKISKYATIISGGAIGIDSIAHINSYPRTIMVSPSSLDIIYPKENEKLIKNIQSNSLIISEYENSYMPHRYSFLERNRIVIALSDIVILPQGDINSGTSSSARFALELNKPIFTLPQRYGESTLTNSLLSQGKAKAIYDIDEFIEKYLAHLESNLDSINAINGFKTESNDEILEFCKSAPSYEIAFGKFGSRLLEYEFNGLLVRENSIIRTK
ncbi:MAG: DNA-protecting protein DprA [Helicobacteraceae bacterium]|nr:DNA-protecting protein DprA [Helicobacteraceae bacterium]